MKEIGPKILMCLFVAIFAAASAYLYYGFGRMLLNVERARDWQAVEGRLIKQEIVTNEGTGDDPDTHRLDALYRYTVAGVQHDGRGVDFSPLRSDNFSGDRRVRQQKMMRQDPLTVYVDPADPLNAVIDRSLPAEQSVFIAFFLLFPCGFATLVVISLLLYPIKPLRGYSGSLTGIVLGAPALWLLARYLPEFGVLGAIILMMVGTVGMAGLYFMGRRFAGGKKPVL